MNKQTETTETTETTEMFVTEYGHRLISIVAEFLHLRNLDDTTFEQYYNDSQRDCTHYLGMDCARAKEQVATILKTADTLSPW